MNLSNPKNKNFIEKVINAYLSDSVLLTKIILLIDLLIKNEKNLEAEIKKLFESVKIINLFRTKNGFFIFTFSLGLYLFGCFFKKIYSNKSKLNTIIAKLLIYLARKIINHLAKDFIFASDVDQAYDLLKKSCNKKFTIDILAEHVFKKDKADRIFVQLCEIIENCKYYQGDLTNNPIGMSVKLSSICPNYLEISLEKAVTILYPKLKKLDELAFLKNILISVDAEEYETADKHFVLLEKVINESEFKAISNVGFVIQGYRVDSMEVINRVIKLSKHKFIKIPIRLVKGAYWNYEYQKIKDNSNLDPHIFTSKVQTNENYVQCAELILNHPECLFLQLAGHNPVTINEVITFARNKEFELQKLYGMANKVFGDNLIDKYSLREYAPIGSIEDIVQYFGRRVVEIAQAETHNS